MFLMLLAGFLVAVLLVAMAAAIARKTKHRLPKGYRRFTPTPLAEKRAVDCTRDAFKERKVPKDVDYVVIGSGMGGLYCAALLAKAGRRVVVLEQHYVAGGCTHSFEDKGYEFDTGLHYVGRIEKYKVLLDLVSTDRKVEWAKNGNETDGFCYDEMKLGSEPIHHFRAGEKAFVDEERASIVEYVELCKKVNKSADLYFFAKLFHPVVQWCVNKFLCQDYFKWANKTSQEVVDSFTSNKHLAALLVSNWGDYGTTPDKASFLVQAGLTAHYLGGGYYPVGGTQEISRALIPTIEAAGGRVLVKASVSRVLVEGGRAVGVALRDGGEVRVTAGGGVISAIGAHGTSRHLMPTDTLREKLGYDAMLAAVSASTSHVYAFVGLEGTAEEVGARGANLWVLPTTDDGKFGWRGEAIPQCKGQHKEEAQKTDDHPPAAEAKGEADEWELVGGESKTKASAAPPEEVVGGGDDDKDMLLFFGFPSVKDPSFATRYPGKTTCIIISPSYEEWFKEHYDEEGGTAKGKNASGKRKDPKYDALKAKFENKFRSALHRHYPKTKGKIKYMDIGTPLTNVYYLGRADSYGLEHTTAHYGGALDQMRPATSIPGLYVTGQDVTTVGIVGALNAGILTAHAILGYGFWDLVVGKRNLIEDLMAADEDTSREELKKSE